MIKNGVRKGRPNFLSWFYNLSLRDMSMTADLKQVAKGCHTRVKSYNTYDVNGYRFRTDKYEKERPNAATINSGVVTIGQGENNQPVEYYGIIKEIVELTFDGRRPLQLVLFNCHWFHPNKVRYTPAYGLIEVAHASALPGYEPFVVAQQATQVYYIPYPCKSVRDLSERWVVYKVQPPGRLPIPSDQDYDFVPNVEVMQFFQEDDIEGTFEVNLEKGFDSIPHSQERDVEEVVDEDDLKLLNSSELFVQAESASLVEEIEDGGLVEDLDNSDASPNEYF